MSANLAAMLRSRLPAAWPGAAVAAMLLLATSLASCASFDPARISINVDPAKFTSIGW